MICCKRLSNIHFYIYYKSPLHKTMPLREYFIFITLNTFQLTMKCRLFSMEFWHFLQNVTNYAMPGMRKLCKFKSMSYPRVVISCEMFCWNFSFVTSLYLAKANVSFFVSTATTTNLNLYAWFRFSVKICQQKYILSKNNCKTY